MERINDLPGLPARDPLGFKGTFGRVCVVGGSCRDQPMIGAPALACRAALRSGCGVCTAAIPAPILGAVLSIVPGATGVSLPVDGDGQLLASGCARVLDEALALADALVVGPGFGLGDPQQQIVLRLSNSFGKPLILDADALRALASAPDFARDLNAPIILTPHAGEFNALANALDLDLDPVDESKRETAVQTLAARLGCIVVLKGAHTQVSDGGRVWRSEFAEPALAIGGSGDVLAGITGSFAAQFAGQHKTRLAGQLSAAALDLFQVACLAVHVHALTAAGWARTHGHAGLLPEELADGIPVVLARLRGELP